MEGARGAVTEREREREQYEIRWKWNRRGARRLPHGREEERERGERREACRAVRGRFVWRAGFGGENGPTDRAGVGRVESEWERFLSLGFKCRCGEGEKERAGGRSGGRGGARATASSDARGGSRFCFGGGGKEIRRRRASVSNATDDNPGGRQAVRHRGRGRSDSLCAYGLVVRSAVAVSAAAAVGIGGGPTTERKGEREREGAFGSAIVTWYETRPPPSLTTETAASSAAAAEDAETTVLDLAFDLKSPPLSFHFHCGSRTVRKQGATLDSLPVDVKSDRRSDFIHCTTSLSAPDRSGPAARLSTDDSTKHR